MIIGVDKGHNKGAGAVKYLNETTENRIIGDKLISMLREKGHTVIDCTNENATNQLSGITKKANAQHLDLFISIHFNAGGGHGTETFVYNGNYPNKEANRKIAKTINDCIVASCNFRNRGLKEANFHVLRETKAQAVLVEVCFVDSLEDKGKLNCDAVAKAIFKGITGTEYSTSIKPPVSPSDGDSMFRVVCGTYANRTNAEAQQKKLKQAGFDSFLVAYKK